MSKSVSVVKIVGGRKVTRYLPEAVKKKATATAPRKRARRKKKATAKPPRKS